MTGSAGTGKTLLLAEALKIKLAMLRTNGASVIIFVTTYGTHDTELLAKYREHYLVNMKDVNCMPLEKLCDGLNVRYSKYEPEQTLDLVVSSLSTRYCDSVVLFICDEVKSMSSDWRRMETRENVIWFLAVNPRSNTNDLNLSIKPPASPEVLSEKLLVKYRNCHEIRLGLKNSTTDTSILKYIFLDPSIIGG